MWRTGRPYLHGGAGHCHPQSLCILSCVLAVRKLGVTGARMTHEAQPVAATLFRAVWGLGEALEHWNPLWGEWKEPL